MRDFGRCETGPHQGLKIKVITKLDVAHQVTLAFMPKAS
jgi:hypothetical protein